VSLFRRQDHPRERTPEERERARYERAARRARERGEPPPPMPDERTAFVDEPTQLAEPAVAPETAAEPEPAWHDEPAPPPAARAAPPADGPAPPPADFAPHAGASPAHDEVEAPAAPEPARFAEPPPPLDPDRFAAPPVARAPQAEPRAELTADEWAGPGQPTEQFTPVWDDEPAPEPLPDSRATEAFTPAFAEPADAEPRVERLTERPAPAPEAPAPAAATRRFVGDDDERPVPLRRAPGRRSLPPTPPPPGEKAPRGLRGSAAGPGRRRRGRLVAALGVLLLLIVAAGYVAIRLYEPFAGDAGERVAVTIAPGATAADIGDVLEREGVVSSSTFFNLRARLSGQRENLRAGRYTLRADMTYAAALDALTQGPPAPRTIRVTLPEGRSRTEAAPLVRQAGLRGSYLDASRRPTDDFNPRRYGAPRGVRSLEGFLFPATYELRPGASARRLVAQQLDAFAQNMRGVSLRRARRRNLNAYDVLTIASMVEREATLPRERPIIAAVIYNRLQRGMPLGIDATIRYATRNWSRPLRVSELNIDSPYNTRRRTGLPPTPIGSPGLASIRAAANPARVNYLFYVVRPGGNGAHNFSSTEEEFQRDVAAYNRARERAGGRDPS